MNTRSPKSPKPRVLVAGWQPPPFNGRVHEVVSLMREPFTERYEFFPYDTRMRNRRGGSRPDAALLRNAITQITGVDAALRAARPELIVFFVGPGAAFWRDMLIFRALRRSGLPVVLRFIGGAITEQIAAFPAGVRRAVLTELRHARVIMTETHAMVEDLRHLAPGVPAFRVPNFVHLEELPAPPADRTGRRVVYFGNMTPSKGVETVLAGVDTVCEQCPGTEFHFIGGELKAGYLDEFRAMAAKLRHAGAVQVHGRMPREAAHALAASADAFAFPTRWPGEGQPAALIEAMAMGIVPVVSRWRGVGEVVQDGVNGLRVEEGDSVALAAALTRVLSDDKLRELLSRGARQTIASSYDARPALEQFAWIVDSIQK